MADGPFTIAPRPWWALDSSRDPDQWCASASSPSIGTESCDRRATHYRMSALYGPPVPIGFACEEHARRWADERNAEYEAHPERWPDLLPDEPDEITGAS